MAFGPSSEPPIQPAVNPEEWTGQPNMEQIYLSIEADLDLEQDEDTDSALGGNDVSSIGSPTESVLEYRSALGRNHRSSKTNDSWAPNDEQRNICYNSMDSSLSHFPGKSGKVKVQQITKVDGVRVKLESEEVSLLLVTPYQTELCRAPPSVTDSGRGEARNPRSCGHSGNSSSASSSNASLPGENSTLLTLTSDDESIASGPQGPSDTASLASDTEDYLDIYGRSFPNPKYGWSWCAVDEKFELTSERDYLFHCRRQDFRLFRAPVAEPTHVLDLKARFGSWADAVAAAYESVDVLGIDNAPVQYATESNCRFELDDINQEWDRELEYFDLIYGNKLLGNVDNWSRLFRNAFDCLSLGGFLNLCDRPFDYTSKNGGIDTWGWVAQQARELGDLFDCSFAITRDTYKNYMAEAGFLDIHEIWEEIPVVDCLDIVLDEIECFLFRKWHLEGVEPDEAERHITMLRSQLESEASEAYTHCVTVWGRKPLVSNGLDLKGGVNVDELTGEIRRGSSKRRHGDVSTSADSEDREIDQYGPTDAKRLKQEQFSNGP